MATSQYFTAIRTLASSAASSGKAVKPPIQVFGLEGRYATALYSAATKLKQLDQVEKDLHTIKNALKTDQKFKDFIQNPVINRALKVDGIMHVASKINLSPASANLLGLLAENGRLGKIDSIANAFSTIMAAHRGDLKCEVITAKPLDEQTKNDLQTALKSFAKKGENIILEMKVDPSIIGGMVVSVGDKYVDMSIASKIKKYTTLIQAAV